MGIEGKWGAMGKLIRGVCLALAAATQTACTGFAFGNAEPARYLTIRRHHFDRTMITIPRETPFELVFAALDYRPVMLSSPALGLDSISIPATQPTLSWARPRPAFDERQVRVQIPPLRPGIYIIRCDCHARVDMAELIVE
jgi:hypothetical protein